MTILTIHLKIGNAIISIYNSSLYWMSAQICPAAASQGIADLFLLALQGMLGKSVSCRLRYYLFEYSSNS